MSLNEANHTGPTGPRTEEGKAISSQNALQTGLFAKQDFVLPDEQVEYSQTQLVLMNELSPQGILEQTFADEIMSANWRLRRCRLTEATLVMRSLEDAAFDEEKVDRKRRSIDRARAAAHSVLRRSMMELRRLQTERQIRLEVDETEFPGLTDTVKVLRAIEVAEADEYQQQPEPAPAPRKRITVADLENLMALADKKLCADVRSEHPSSFCSTNETAASQPAATAAPNRQNRFGMLRNSRNQAA
jgi:hypothetical protein